MGENLLPLRSICSYETIPFMADSLKKIGLIGGTFDPVHKGHLHLAEQAQKLFDLQQVIFIPAYRSPHKLTLEPVSCEHRLAMLTLALENQPYFSIDKLEIKKNKVSYTIETLKDLNSLHPDWEIFLILGADAFQTMDTWKECSQLLGFCSILVGTRPGTELKISKSVQHKLSLEEPEKKVCHSSLETELIIFKNRKKRGQLILFQISPLDISSNEIRQRISNKEEIKNLLPPSVDHYIMKHRLYQDDSPSTRDLNE